MIYLTDEQRSLIARAVEQARATLEANQDAPVAIRQILLGSDIHSEAYRILVSVARTGDVTAEVVRVSLATPPARDPETVRVFASLAKAWSRADLADDVDTLDAIRDEVRTAAGAEL